jgi:DNA-directed RNA polymerase subunit omega
LGRIDADPAPIALGKGLLYMARVTVEDCIEKVTNRFELVLLASHRARAIANGAPMTIDQDNDKNPVVSLREIAEATVSPNDLKEDFIHSIQKHVEVDEPEPVAAPLLPADRRMPVLGRDDQSSDTVIDVLSEDQLLRGMESMAPMESSAGGGGRGR